ncbi:hypothetical protein PDE_02057 [Penicillium oxalicum 114-2]|uniref:Uncharacterized protein n=1 Tax=Penicillium oxalicum (strain 114-2 / CGMCC 5302) TaxID=933388 RepID=S7ZEK5_PENO1|nr:hypothetical protein PDE_02057 [Penicillium oxalicum 114-2]
MEIDDYAPFSAGVDDSYGKKTQKPSGEETSPQKRTKMESNKWSIPTITRRWYYGRISALSPHTLLFTKQKDRDRPMQGEWRNSCAGDPVGIITVYSDIHTVWECLGEVSPVTGHQPPAVHVIQHEAHKLGLVDGEEENKSLSSNAHVG